MLPIKANAGYSQVTTKDAPIASHTGPLEMGKLRPSCEAGEIGVGEGELEDLLRQIEEKRDMFDSFSGTALWDAVGLDRKDSRFIDGLSSDFERLMSSSKTSTGIDGWPSCVAQSEVHGGNFLGVVLETEEENAD